MAGNIVVRGARVHNLKNLDVEIPRDRLVVITGVSGSGKSSLAFDTLYAEGQRRYLESLSAASRRFVRPLPRPDVDGIEGLSPAIAIESKTGGFGPRSTLGTLTEIAEFLRVLYARIGQPSCPNCGVEIAAETTEEIVDRLMALPEGTRLVILAPVTAVAAKNLQRTIRELARAGFTRLKVDGNVVEITDETMAPGSAVRSMAVIIDRLTLRAGIEPRLADSLELASRAGKQRITIEVGGTDTEPPREIAFSQKLACPRCGLGFPDLTPSLFSFNSPQGACPKCGGLGYRHATTADRQDEHDNALCGDCGGTRLNRTARAVRVGGKSIAQIASWPATDLLEFLRSLELTGKAAAIGAPLIGGIQRRLELLARLGLGYLSLDRAADTLSGGEAQRARLATQLGASLTGVLYILDEPSIGLHQRDNAELLAALRELRDLGNSVILVEHDPEAIRTADRVIDMGPGAGVNGGRVIAQGTPTELIRAENSLTGQYLSGRRVVPVPRVRRAGTGDALSIRGASCNNLKALTVQIPLGTMTVVSGVSGSGKSTLVMDVLYPALVRRLRGRGKRTKRTGTALDQLGGWEQVDRVVAVDQSPIGRTPRSNPATYVGIYDPIRRLFSQLPEAKVRGYSPNRFSFNAPGGRCEACGGNGLMTIEMDFLPDVYVVCDVCQGRRYNRETLEVKFKGLSIADVLDLTVTQALEPFNAQPAVFDKLQTLASVGLGYIKLGQPAHTLSGGEAQRVKLAKELGRRATGRTLYILDEPTSGLHFADVEKLLELLQKLVDLGHTVLVIEHNLDVIKAADHVIDLGPEAGAHGGRVVACGSPEQIARCQQSHTGRFLARVLGMHH